MNLKITIILSIAAFGVHSGFAADSANPCHYQYSHFYKSGVLDAFGLYNSRITMDYVLEEVFGTRELAVLSEIYKRKTYCSIANESSPGSCDFSEIDVTAIQTDFDRLAAKAEKRKGMSRETVIERIRELQAEDRICPAGTAPIGVKKLFELL